MEETEFQIIKNADSLGNALDYAVQSDPSFGLLYGKRPQFDPYKAYNIIKNDPIVKGATISIVDKFILTPWRVVDRKSRKLNKDKTSKLRELRFHSRLRDYVTAAIIFKNAYLEIVKKGEEPTDLNIIETAFMKINTKTNGDVLSYSQYVGNVSTHNLPEWTPEEVCHWKLDRMNTNAWSDSDLQVMYDTIMIKDYARQFVLWLFSTNQLRPVISVESKMNTTKAEDFLSWLKATERDLRRPIILEGKITVQALYNFAESGATILEFVKWCDSQILALLQTPPIVMGMTDKSGRSNSVEQYTGFDTRIRSLQLDLQDLFSYDLFPKMGWEDTDFEFDVLDFKHLKETIETVQVAKNAMFSDDAIKELMARAGISLETEELFKDPVEEARKMAEMQQEVNPQPTVPGMNNKSVGTGNEGSLGHKSADLAPSRMRQSDSSASKATLKDKKMVANSELTPNPLWVL